METMRRNDAVQSNGRQVGPCWPSTMNDWEMGMARVSKTRTPRNAEAFQHSRHCIVRRDAADLLRTIHSYRLARAARQRAECPERRAS